MRIVYALVLLVLTAACVSAAPAGNTAINTTTTTVITTTTTIAANGTFADNVQDGVREMGHDQFEIIATSTATFLFCIWTSIHLDITPDVPSRYRVLYKFIWMLVTIIIPEVTIICAYSQRQVAKKLKEAWREKFDGLEAQSAFGMKEAFLVVMGGFTVDEFEREDAQGETPVPYTTTLTPRGFKKYLENDLIHEGTFDTRSADGSLKKGIISHRMIADKGVTSVGGKVIATVQVLAFLTQFASRLAFKMQLTLLEVHVAIQVLSAIVAWVCWWDKPLEVNEPIYIIPLGHLETSETAQVLSQPAVNKPEHKSLEIEPVEMDPSVQNNKSSEVLEIKALLANPWCQTCRESSIKKSKYHDWSLPYITRSILSGPIAIIARACYDITKYIEMGKDSPANEVMGKVVEVLIIFIIGALHASMWNFPFPTPVEGILWKISSLGIFVLPIGVTLISVNLRFIERVIKAANDVQHVDMNVFKTIRDALKTIYAHKPMRDWKGWKQESYRKRFVYISKIFGQFILTTSSLLFVAVYASCILFITVESYISLRAPPDGSLSTVEWAFYWPHV